MSVTVSEQPNGDFTLGDLDVAWNSGDYRLDKLVGDAHSVKWLVGASETLSVAESYVDQINFIVNVVESIAVAELISKGCHLPVSEAFSVSDKRSALMHKRFFHSIGVADTFGRAVDYARGFFELVSVIELASKNQTINVNSELSLSDSVVKTFDSNINESLALSDSLMRVVSFARDYSEAVSVSDSAAKSVLKQHFEDFEISDLKMVDFQKSIATTLTMVEAFGRVVQFSRGVDEGMSIGESLSKALELNPSESVAIADNIVRNAEAVVSDLIIGSGDVSADAFVEYLQRQSPVGYRDFREFVEGEYSYKNALFKIVLDSIGAERAMLDKLTVTVDLPDVRDRGSASLDSSPSGLYIPFTRQFHAKPEVIVQVIGGTVVSIPRVLSSDKNGFTVVLKDTSGNTVAGTINWSAEGY